MRLKGFSPQPPKGGAVAVWQNLMRITLMKIIIYLLLFLTFSISILNANSYREELNIQLIGNNHQQNELQREKIQKEYLFRPDSIWGTDLLGMIIGSDFYTYHNNHIGTPEFMTDLTGTKVWESKTDSFGQVDITLSAIENNIRLAGQYFDSETGLHYNWNRYYDPSTGRYISQDPIGFSGGISLYGYVGQNPISGIDPMGLFLWIPALAIFAVTSLVSFAIAPDRHPLFHAVMGVAGVCSYALGGAILAIMTNGTIGGLAVPITTTDLILTGAFTNAIISFMTDGISLALNTPNLSGTGVMVETGKVGVNVLVNLIVGGITGFLGAKILPPATSAYVKSSVVNVVNSILSGLTSAGGFINKAFSKSVDNQINKSNKAFRKDYENSISPKSLQKQDFINEQSSRNSLGPIFKSLNEGF